MTEAEGGRTGGAVAHFAERYGIDRRRATIAAALLGSIVVVALYVMNQRIQERRTVAVDPPEAATALVGHADPDEVAGERAAWADPEAARRLAGDTLPGVSPADPSVPGGGYVPLGREVGPGTYDGARGEEFPGEPSGRDPESGYLDVAPTEAIPADQRPLTPEEMRRIAFQRAVSSRELRTRGMARDSSARMDSAAARGGADPWGTSGTSGPSEELRPYGPAEQETDRRAAERAGEALAQPQPRPQALHRTDAAPVAWFVSAASTSRPCREGERVLSGGYVITATLVSRLDSEVPGPVLARIGRDVYDAALRCVIIPAGALLVGRYPDGLTSGGQRLLVVWEQVVLGDGRTWTLPALPAADRQGGMGIAGRVDRRTRETLQAAALLSAFGAVIEYATPGGGQPGESPSGGYPAVSARDRAVGAATEPLRGAAERLLDRATGIRPVLRLDAGQPITVIVPREVDLDRLSPAETGPLPDTPDLPGSQA